MQSTSSSPSTSSPSGPTHAVEDPEEKKPPLFSSHLAAYFIAGGAAGATSRTVVSPLERLKIIQCVYIATPYIGAPVANLGRSWRLFRQVQPRTGGQLYKGVWRSLVRMWKEEGFKGFMRGNGINCVRIVPYSAVQFTTYEQLKKVRDSSSPRRLSMVNYLFSSLQTTERNH